MRDSRLTIDISTEDVGATQVAEVTIGGISIGRWHTHTRYPDTSFKVAESAIRRALKPLIEQGFEDESCEPYIERQDEEDF